MPERPSELLLRTTFGLLSSSDAGANWDWICEQAIGFTGTEDPALAALDQGVVLAGLQSGLARSADAGCSWSHSDALPAGLLIVDFAVHSQAGSSAVALAWESQPVSATAPGYRARFYATEDGGVSWHAQGTSVDPSVLVLTLDVAPSDPHRLYASGVRNGSTRSAVLLVSPDDGQHWSERAAPFDARTEQGLYIAAVDPLAADLVYLRTAGASSSRLLVTHDAGLSFEQRFSGGPMLGFALSPDGSRIYLGGSADGLWSAASSDLAFEQRARLEVACLTSTASTLYACSNELNGFALGASDDDGHTFAPALHLANVRGPLACLTGTAAELCREAWPAVSAKLGVAPTGAGTPGATEGMPRGAQPESLSSATGCSASPTASRFSRAVFVGTALLLGAGWARRRARHLSCRRPA